jgi:hypothetical protein
MTAATVHVRPPPPTNHPPHETGNSSISSSAAELHRNCHPRICTYIRASEPFSNMVVAKGDPRRASNQCASTLKDTTGPAVVDCSAKSLLVTAALGKFLPCFRVSLFHSQPLRRVWLLNPLSPATSMSLPRCRTWASTFQSCRPRRSLNDPCRYLVRSR